ncbi:MAG TPA: hypothetical protein VEZ55_08090 [Chitinophagaceae bacterium]|jgi:hypothetical protein|nr:hypothetical protein [Chitinophagaceae bacterium]
MEVEIFTLCDFAQDNQGKLTVVGTFDRLNAPVLPFTFPHMSLAARLRFANSEAGEKHVRIRFVAPDGAEIQSANLNVTIVSSPIGYSAVNIVFNVNQQNFTAAGMYSFELYVDEEWESGLKLFVVQANQQ